MPRSYCPHERLQRHKKSENLVGLIVMVAGRPSTGKTSLAKEIAKALRCTFLEYDRLRSCIPAGAGSTSDDDPVYQIIWKMAETHLDGRNHHMVVDSPLSRRVELDRLLGIAKSHDAVVILIDCVVDGKDEQRRRLEAPHDDRDGEEALGRDLERSLMMEEESENDRFYDYDPGEIDVPKLTIDATPGAELDQHFESVKKLILTSLDEKLTSEEGDGTVRCGCSRCTLDAVRRRFASFPETFKHELHGDEFHLWYPGDDIIKGRTFMCRCSACLRPCENLFYSWGELLFHPECVLELPLQVTHKCHRHALRLTLLPPKDETNKYYCEVCTKARHADSWIYYCRGCEYKAHIPCVVPHLPGNY